MRLPRPFYRLPVLFDVVQLAAEVQALPESAWTPHPNAIEGNSCVRLISVNGAGNDDVRGPMQPTPELLGAPYLRQVLASFGVVWSRSRLMRLAPCATVPLHADINHHWYSRVRVHIPVQTHPDVAFHCGDERVHMAAGEAWLFDNWRLHRVDNPTPLERIHLVADTSGAAPFWRLALQAGLPVEQWIHHRFDPSVEARLMTEHSLPAPCMPAAEVELLLGDLGSELESLDRTEAGRTTVLRYRMLLNDFCHDWRQLCALHGDRGDGRGAFEGARDALRDGSRQLGGRLVMRTNRVAAHQVLEARVLRHLLDDAETAPPPGSLRRSGHSGPVIRSPVFIVAAPRSGSTLLFETLAAHESFATLGGEAHWLVEGIAALRPGAPGVDSNRLTAAALSDDIGTQICHSIRERLVDHAGQPAGDRQLRLLEKTPKNALRIPFFRQLFPDCRFIFLWRDPRENISSIIEAWRSGNWVTYPELPGWEGPWSLLLPPQWQLQKGRSLEEIAAWQWDSANRHICDDLAAINPAHWTSLCYADLRDSAPGAIARLCGFLGMPVDGSLARRLAAPLPLSRYTQTPPAPDKWRLNEALVGRVLPGIASTWQQLQRLQPR